MGESPWKYPKVCTVFEYYQKYLNKGRSILVQTLSKIKLTLDGVYSIKIAKKQKLLKLQNLQK